MNGVMEYSTEGCNYGDIKLENNEITLGSMVSSKPILNVKLENVALCVVPANNRNEIEIQFLEAEKAERHDDGLVQMTLHFPIEDNEDGVSRAELFQKEIMDTGVIRSVTGNIIAEFSKEQGNFVTPRGKYTIQMTSTYMHMQGAQYAYKIKYDDISALFLLPKMDGGRMAFVISLEKPIRQGNQKYQNLVLETHKLEHTLKVNLTEEECASRYEGQLAPSMTMPMSSLIAKVFKVLSQKKVFIPKQFLSARDAHCIRCSIKANDGLLYPLAKSFIFINKPCVILRFEDIDYAEFKRYEPAANSATRNFDLCIYLKDSAASAQQGDGGASGSGGKEYAFMSIDRSEYAPLFDYLNSKEIRVKNPVEVGPAAAYGKAGGLGDEGGGDSDAGGSDESDDGDYEGGGNSSHSGDSDDSGSDSEADSQAGGDGEEEKKPKKVHTEKASTKRKASSEGESSGRAGKGRSSGAAGKGGDSAAPKKKRAKKDKDAPKGASSSYIMFSTLERPKVMAENPGMTVTDCSRELGTRWKTLTADEKAPYEERARADKERFHREMAAYQEKKSAEGGDEEDGGDDEAEGSGADEPEE